MRGLKQNVKLVFFVRVAVASFTDAWIETSIIYSQQMLSEVASFTDAWIETPIMYVERVNEESHLLQMRGLKRYAVTESDFW